MKDKHEKEQLTDLAFERFKGLAFERFKGLEPIVGGDDACPCGTIHQNTCSGSCCDNPGKCCVDQFGTKYACAGGGASGDKCNWYMKDQTANFCCDYDFSSTLTCGCGDALTCSDDSGNGCGSSDDKEGTSCNNKKGTCKKC